jgi:hypothetical protein
MGARYPPRARNSRSIRGGTTRRRRRIHGSPRSAAPSTTGALAPASARTLRVAGQRHHGWPSQPCRPQGIAQIAEIAAVALVVGGGMVRDDVVGVAQAPSRRGEVEGQELFLAPELEPRLEAAAGQQRVAAHDGAAGHEPADLGGQGAVSHPLAGGV